MTDTRKLLENEKKPAQKESVLKSSAQKMMLGRSHFLVLPATYIPRPPTPVEKEGKYQRKSNVFHLASREIMFKSKPSSRSPEYKKPESVEVSVTPVTKSMT